MFEIRFRHSVTKNSIYGSNSIRYYDPMIWSLVSEEIIYTNSLDKLKTEIRRWKPNDCPCRVCENYIADVGFLEIFE